MKKFLLVAATTALISSAANAECMYLKVEGSWATLPKQKDTYANVDVKSKNTFAASAAFGYKFADMFRGELAFTHLFDPKFTYSNDTHGSTNHAATPVAIVAGANGAIAGALVTPAKLEVTHKLSVNSLMANVYADIAATDMFGIFLGAGAGMAMVENTTTYVNAANVASVVTPAAVTAITTPAGATPALVAAQTAALAAHQAATASPESGEAKSKSKYNFAFNVKAGVAFAVSEGVFADVSYTYSNFGKTGEAKYKGTSTAERTVAPMNAHSHHVGLGLRFDM